MVGRPCWCVGERLGLRARVADLQPYIAPARMGTRRTRIRVYALPFREGMFLHLPCVNILYYLTPTECGRTRILKSERYCDNI